MGNGAENIAIIRGLGGKVSEGRCISANEAILCAEVERLTTEVGQLKQGMWRSKDREIEQLKVDCECHRIQAVDRGNSYQKAAAERDRYKAALELAVEELAAKNRHTRQETCETASARVLIQIDRVLTGGAETAQSEESCESCHEPLGDDAPLYEDADICRSCHDEIQAAEAVRG